MEAGSVANGSTPTSADACMSIVHSLSCHRQGGKSFICLQFRISKKARKIGRNLPLDLMSTYLVSIKVEISTTVLKKAIPIISQFQFAFQELYSTILT